MEKSQIENLIRKWAIAGTQENIEKSQHKIDLIQTELKSLEGTEIPKHIPGPEMIREMLKEMKCNICDRGIDSKEDSAYKSLEQSDLFEINQRHRWLKKNFDELRSKKFIRT